MEFDIYGLSMGPTAISGGSKDFEKGDGRQFISSVLIYRKCAEQNI